MDSDLISNAEQSSSKLSIFLTKFFNPNHPSHKYLALCFICLLGFGNYFSYDSPGALEVDIENVMKIDTSQFTSLYALYGWPNIAMCLIGGVLVDRYFGVRLAAIVFNSILVVGQIIVSLGAYTGNFWLMQVGRFSYGIGGESLIIAQNTYLIRWFKEHNINSVFGIQGFTMRVPAVLVYNILQPIFNKILKNKSLKPQQALGLTLLLPVAACTLSLLSSFIIAYIDIRAERLRNKQDEDIQAQVLTISDSYSAGTGLASEDRKQGFDFEAILKFKLRYWLLVFATVNLNLTVFPLVAVGSKFLQTKWKYNKDVAEMFDSTIYFVSMLLSPVMGVLIDKFGRNLYFILAASFLTCTAHLLLGLTFVAPWIGFATIGVGLAIITIAPYPLIARVVPQEHLATAFGTLSALINLFSAITSNFSGALVDWKGFTALEELFTLCAGLSLVLIVSLIFYDARPGHTSKMNLSTSESEVSLAM